VRIEAEDQMELFADDFSRQKRVEEAVFRLRQKMGDDTLTKASLMKTGGDERARRPR